MSLLERAKSVTPEKPEEEDKGAFGMGGFAIGGIKGVVSTVKGMSSLGEAGLNAAMRVITPKSLESKLGIEAGKEASVEKFIPKKLIERRGIYEKLGFGTEQLAEYFLPGGAALKAEKAIKYSSTFAKLASKAGVFSKLTKKVVPLTTRALTEGGLQGGQTALQQGELNNEVAIQTVFGTAFPFATTAIKPVAKFGIKAAGEILGKTTGAGIEAIKLAFNNPKVMQFARIAGVDGIEGLQKKAVESAKSALGLIKKARGYAYEKALNLIKLDTSQKDDIALNIRNKVRDLLGPNEYDISFGETTGDKLNKLDFSTSVITEGTAPVERAVNDTLSWTDWTAAGLDKLKKRLDAFKSQTAYGTPARALLTDLHSSLNTQLKESVTGYETMTKGYHEASNLIEEIEKGLSLGDKTSIQTTVNKLMSTMRQNFEMRKELLTALSKAGGKDIEAQLAGSSLSSFTPRGLSGTLTPTAGAVAYIASPANWPALVMLASATSPRLVGELVSALGKLTRTAKGVIKSSPEVESLIKRIFGSGDDGAGGTGGAGNKVDDLNIKSNIDSKQGDLLDIQTKASDKKFGPGAMDFDEQRVAQTLKTLNGLSADDIMKQHPDILLKKDVQATDVYGNKVTLPEGDPMTPYELKGGKVVLQDGETYIVSKNQFQNIKGNAVSGEVKEFAPELKSTEETIKESPTSQAERNKKLTESFQRGELSNEEYLTKQSTQKTSNTKYSQYQLPDSENYKEILIKAPTTPTSEPNIIKQYKGKWAIFKKSEPDFALASGFKDEIEAKKAADNFVPEMIDKNAFKSSHWDEPNVISHLRLNERTYKGEKVTFMEELQSDWAREGRSKGFMREMTPEELTQVQKNRNYVGSTATHTTTGEIANNPLLKNWQELSVKRALKEAVDNDSTYFAWINGEQTSARYSLSTYLDNVEWQKGTTIGKKKIFLSPKDSPTIHITISDSGIIKETSKGEWQGKKLDEVLGKGLADKIMADETGTLSGEGLSFGGEWANNLYDKQVGNIVSNLTGAKIEKLDMGLPISKVEQNFYPSPHQIVNGANRHITIGELKVEKEIGRGDGTKYIITDILGDGKFKAIPKKYVDDIAIRYPESSQKELINKLGEHNQEMFDISTKKSAGQQGIKLTPEIKAKIKGEALELKKASGKSIVNNPSIKDTPIKVVGYDHPKGRAMTMWDLKKGVKSTSSNPIIIDENKNVLDGAHRLEQARLDGKTNIKTIEIKRDVFDNLSTKQMKELGVNLEDASKKLRSGEEYSKFINDNFINKKTGKWKSLEEQLKDTNLPKTNIVVKEGEYNRAKFDKFFDNIEGDTIPFTHETTSKGLKEIMKQKSLQDMFLAVGHLNEQSFVTGKDGYRVLFDAPRSELKASKEVRDIIGQEYNMELDTMDHSNEPFTGYNGHISMTDIKKSWIKDILDYKGNSVISKFK